ncbi:MFS transporter [Paraburkholderia sediminicola]|uniref:MFS transporter n=1 Tax=Paraburkholderia sediminicola TaxID=458836 RepID=UPI0038BBF9EF
MTLADIGAEAAPREHLIDADGRVYAGWRSTFGATAALSVGASTSTIMCFGVFVPYLHRAFGWGIGAIALAATLLSISIMVISPIQGALVDRFGARRIIMISIPLFGLGYAAMSQLSGDINQFYLMWVLVPLLGFGVWPSSYIKVVTGWFDQRLGLAIGVANIGIGIGSVVLPAMIGAVANAYGWRMAYVAVGVLSVVIAWPCAYCFVFERNRPARVQGDSPGEPAPAQRSGAMVGVSVREAWADASFWKILISFLLLGAGSTTLLVNQVAILVDNGMPVPSAVVMQSVIGVSTLCARLFVGWLLDRVAVKRVMPILSLSGAAAMLLYASGATGMTAALCAVLIGIMTGAEFNVLGYALRRYFGPRVLGTLFGTAFAVFQLGGAIATGLVGYARGHTGSYQTSLYFLAAVTALTAVLMCTLGRYRFLDRRPPAPIEAQSASA